MIPGSLFFHPSSRPEIAHSAITQSRDLLPALHLC
jgi:hypothetical protein